MKCRIGKLKHLLSYKPTKVLFFFEKIDGERSFFCVVATFFGKVLAYIAKIVYFGPLGSCALFVTL